MHGMKRFGAGAKGSQVEPSENAGTKQTTEAPLPTGDAHTRRKALRATRGRTSASRTSVHPADVRVFTERYMLVGIWILMIATFAIAAPSTFLQGATFQTIFSGSAIYVLLGLSALCTAVVGDLDLSVPFIAGLSATFVPTLVSLHGWNVAVASLVTIAVACLAGLLNGLIVVRARVEALIGTLGTGTVFLAIGEGVSHQGAVSGLSAGFGGIATKDFLGLAAFFWYGIVLALFMAYLIAYTPLGRHMTFVGASREVARLAGVRVDRIRLGAYVWGGLLAGVAGVLLSAQLRGFDATASNQYLLPTFAVLFLSAAVVRPGRFHPVGVVIAGYFIATGTVGLEILGFSGWIEQLFYGAALVLAVGAVSTVRRYARSTS